MTMNETQPIETPISERGIDEESEFEVQPEDFDECKVCKRELTEDEKVINARFVNEAISAQRDIALFPVCIACNFEKLEEMKKEANVRQQRYTKPKETKGVFFYSNKKFYETNQFQNSEDFKQLGTLSPENRASDYYPLEAPQPLNYANSPLSKILMDMPNQNSL